VFKEQRKCICTYYQRQFQLPSHFLFFSTTALLSKRAKRLCPTTYGHLAQPYRKLWKTAGFPFVLLVYFSYMKMQIAAICFNERELELYIGQLKAQGFESLSDIKKADDGAYYLVMAKASKFDSPIAAKAPAQLAEALPA
jgi:hypothetical protein